jgi:uncharacterized protein HemY
LTFATRAQVRQWSDSGTLFQHALEVMPDNYVAHLGLAKALMQEKNWDGAAEHFRAALVLRPGLREVRRGLDEALRAAERIRKARAAREARSREASG